jgi:hypothetical protein
MLLFLAAAGGGFWMAGGFSRATFTGGRNPILIFDF